VIGTHDSDAVEAADLDGEAQALADLGELEGDVFGGTGFGAVEHEGGSRVHGMVVVGGCYLWMGGCSAAIQVSLSSIVVHFALGIHSFLQIMMLPFVSIDFDSSAARRKVLSKLCVR
jgi:hypothetical protein